MELIRRDIKAGGSMFYCMMNDAGMKMYGRAEYLKIEKLNCIVYKQQFCNENEKVLRKPTFFHNIR